MTLHLIVLCQLLKYYAILRITAAAGNRITHPLFAYLFAVDKRVRQSRTHSGSPRRTFMHCEVFAPAASRRTWFHVSETISGPSLSRPVRIMGMLGIYPNICLIRRSPILRCLAAFSKEAFQPLLPIGYYPHFRAVIPFRRAG